MLPVVSTSSSDNIKDYIKCDQLFTFELDNVLTLRSLHFTNRLRYPGPPKQTLIFLLVHGFQFHQKIDYVGQDVCLWKRTEAYQEPTITGSQAQAFFLTETLPTWVKEVIVYKDDGGVVAMTVPKLFPGGFGSNNGSLVMEKLLTQGFISGKKVETPIGIYWVFSRTVAYVPVLTAQAIVLEDLRPLVSGSGFTAQQPSPLPSPTATATAVTAIATATTGPAVAATATTAASSSSPVVATASPTTTSSSAASVSVINNSSAVNTSSSSDSINNSNSNSNNSVSQ
eukprot:gene9185-10144_t